VDEGERGIYHVQSRCVRRSWLCGRDRETGRDFSHRRAWIERRILELAETFSISIYGFAVMSNHYHIVLETQPQACVKWSDEEVAERWLSVCPGRKPPGPGDEIGEQRKQSLLSNPRRLETLRHRLGSLSWFMRFINEPLARMANREDDCTGRFWQGRFESQRLLDEGAVLAAMVYVDLNPVRAGIAEDVMECEYTSMHERLRRQKPSDRLKPLNRGDSSLSISPISLFDYLSLVRWTALNQSHVRRAGAVAHPSLQRRQIDIDQWMDHYLPRPGCWRKAIGSLQSLRDYAKHLGQRWIQVRHASVAH
jgi:REP element-mobilizing transposase RayT